MVSQNKNSRYIYDCPNFQILSMCMYEKKIYFFIILDLCIIHKTGFVSETIAICLRRIAYF